jgi:Protein of unknown function (DUF3455)
MNSPLKSLAMLTMICSVTFVSCDDKDEVDPASPAFAIQQSESITVPDEVKVPESAVRVATYYAKGYQIYRAQQVAGSNPAQYEWFFVAPSADLYDNNNHLIGGHFTGPTWSLPESNSTINAQAFTPAKAKNMDAASIDWLLLMPKSGSTASGIFSDVDFIQRIVTVGGRAPSTPPTGLTGEIGVYYTAIYRFSKNP